MGIEVGLPGDAIEILRPAIHDSDEKIDSNSVEIYECLDAVKFIGDKTGEDIASAAAFANLSIGQENDIGQF